MSANGSSDDADDHHHHHHHHHHNDHHKQLSSPLASSGSSIVFSSSGEVKWHTTHNSKANKWRHISLNLPLIWVISYILHFTFHNLPFTLFPLYSLLHVLAGGKRHKEKAKWISSWLKYHLAIWCFSKLYCLRSASPEVWWCIKQDEELMKVITLPSCQRSILSQRRPQWADRLQPQRGTSKCALTIVSRHREDWASSIEHEDTREWRKLRIEPIYTESLACSMCRLSPSASLAAKAEWNRGKREESQLPRYLRGRAEGCLQEAQGMRQEASGIRHHLFHPRPQSGTISVRLSRSINCSVTQKSNERQMQ